LKSEIKILCDGCNKIHLVERTKEIPKSVSLLGCNWCPECKETAVYKEWYYINSDMEYMKYKLDSVFVENMALDIDSFIQEFLNKTPKKHHHYSKSLRKYLADKINEVVQG